MIGPHDHSRHRSIAAGEHVLPGDPRRHLHEHEERHDGADGDREAGEALEEEGVAEEHQEDELRRAGPEQRVTHAGDDAEVADDEGKADGGGRAEGDVHRHMVDEIREQEVEREERRGDEPVVHRMQRRTGCRADHDHHCQEEQQRHGREKRDARGEGAGVELLGQLHADRLPRNEVRERPGQPPAAGRSRSSRSARRCRRGSRCPSKFVCMVRLKSRTCETPSSAPLKA